MAQNVNDVVSEFVIDEQQLICQDGDWQCMLQNIYKGYVLLVEAVVDNGQVDEEGNPIYETNAVDVSSLTNAEIQSVIDNMKVVYPNAVEYRLHFCGSHIGKKCVLIKV